MHGAETTKNSRIDNNMETMKALRAMSVVPILILLYLSAGIPLLLRNVLHRITICFDMSFDWTAKIGGMDCKYWPLPKASDAPLPFQEDLEFQRDLARSTKHKWTDGEQ